MPNQKSLALSGSSQTVNNSRNFITNIDKIQFLKNGSIRK